MIKGTEALIVDNSGGKRGYCIEVYKRRRGVVGSVVKLVIREIKKGDQKLKKGVMERGVIVMLREEKGMRSGENSVVLVKENGSPRGNRVKGMISSGVRSRKIRSLTTSLM